MDREQTTIRLPAELKERLQQEADKRNQSFNGLINFLLAKGIERINQGLLCFAVFLFVLAHNILY